MSGAAQPGLTIAQRARWTRLAIYRGVAWAGLVLQPLEIVFQLLTHNPHGPLVLRVAVALGLAAFLVASYASEWSRRHLGELAFAYTILPLANCIGDLIASQVSMISVLAPCVTMFAITLVLHTRRLILCFLAVWTPALTIAAFLAPDPIVDPRVAGSTFVAVALLVGFTVTSYMRLREQQATADRVMEVLFERAADGILFSTLDLQLQGANQRARELFETDDLVQIRDLSYAAWQEASTPADEVSDNEFDGQRKCLVRTAKGNSFWGDIVVRRISTEQGVLLLVRITDIGIHMAVQSQMRAAKESAEAAVLMRDRFLANVSHEIRTPMNGVIAMTSLMLNSPLSEQQREFLSAIRMSGETMLTIINEILDFSKLEAGVLELEQQPFDLEHCASEAIGIVAPGAMAKEIEIVLDVGTLRHRQFVGDVSRFRQVLLNLLSNAVKFTPSGVIEVVVSDNSAEGNVTVAVQDTGIGIAPEHQSWLFEPFTQADASTTRRYGGTGLGLSICKTLVERMGGHIEVFSSLGAGARFEFSLPLHALPESARPPPPEGSGKVIAMCVAQPTLGRVCAGLIAEAGCVPMPCATPAAALAAVGAHACLIDVGMHEAVAALAERARLQASEALVVIGLSAFDGASVRTAGVDVELRKPVSPADLRAQLDRIARGELPLAGALRGQVAALPPLPTPRPTVLLAEDNAINQIVARRVLESLGIAADVAADGREVLHMLRQRQYDVVLMDVQMPELDGIDATRAIRAAVDAHQPYVVAMTANVLASDRAACIAAGMNDFVGKPIRVADVHSALLNAHEHLHTQRSQNSLLQPV